MEDGSNDVGVGEGEREIVVVGASWGGLHALGVLMSALPADFDMPLAIVQHRARNSESLLGELLQDATPLPVSEVDDKEPMLPGHVYVAPPDYHLMVEAGHFSLTTDPLVRYSRPSIDVTFMSAADAYGPRVIGVVLTGANDDGSHGLKYIVERGGSAVVQDPATAESPAMPQAALRAVPSARVLPVGEIGPYLVARSGARRRRRAQRAGTPEGRAGRPERGA